MSETKRPYSKPKLTDYGVSPLERRSVSDAYRFGDTPQTHALRTMESFYRDFPDLRPKVN